MSKKIKAIKCPQCGSTKQHQIDEEHYKCLNCDTEYILDNDDINITHNYTYTIPTTAPVSAKKVLLIVLGVLAFPILIFVVIALFSKTEETITETFEGNTYMWLNATQLQPFVDDNGAFKIVMMGNVDYNSRSGSDADATGKVYWGVYDVNTETMGQVNQLQDYKAQKSVHPSDLKSEAFDDGNIYFVLGADKLFAYNIKNNSLTNITTKIEQKIPQLNSGIGAIKPLSNTMYAFEIISNMGKKITYFPSTNLQINDITTYDESASELNNATLTTRYAASQSSPNYIIQYQALNKVGYPIFLNNRFSIEFDENENPTSVKLIKNERFSYIKNYKILNPDSKLFQLKILDYNENGVLIAFKNSIREGEKYVIQFVANDGAIKWTYQTDLANIYDISKLNAANEAFISSPNNFYYLDANGKLIKHFKRHKISFSINK